MDKIQEISKKKGMHISTLGELLDTKSETFLTGGATPRGAVYVSDGVKFIRVQNVKEGYLDLEDVVYINPETHERELNRSKLKPNDVLLSITGSYGNSCVVSKDIGEANINQHNVKMEVNHDMIDPHYLSYFLNSRLCRQQMDRAVTGSSRPALDYSAIKSLTVLYPDLREQQKIVESIRKIESEAFKKMEDARNLIKKDHEVVLAKLKIELPSTPQIRHFEVASERIIDRLDAITYDPKYDELIDRLKEAPYKPKHLSPELANFETEIINPMNQKDKPFKYVELKDVTGELGEIESYKECYGVELHAPKVIFHEGDILLSRLRYYLRKVVLIPATFVEGLGSSEFYVLKCSKNVNPFFLTTILRHEIVLRQAEHKVTGSSRPRLTKKDIETFLIPYPPLEVQNDIASSITKMYEEAKKLRSEASALLKSARSKLDEYYLAQEI
jgi:restriction endonuclease S subunit